jgi:hypothetical protein
VADEHTDPVKIIDELQFQVTAGDRSSIHSFQLEFDSGQRLTRLREPWVVYVRNVAMLRDITDPTSVFARPVPGAVPPGGGGVTGGGRITAPRNLRIVPSGP